MTSWFRLTLCFLALLCLLLHLIQPADLNHQLRLSAGDHGSIEGENPHPTCSPFRLSEAWNFGLVLDLGNL